MEKDGMLKWICNLSKWAYESTVSNWIKWARQPPLETDSNWIKETQGTLMLVATVIATVTFQSIVNPPKELTQDFLTFNTIAFISALSIILLLISGLPLKDMVCAWLLTIFMFSTIIFIALTYMSVIKTVPRVNSSNDDRNLKTSSQDKYSWYRSVKQAYYGSIIALTGVFAFVFLVHTARCIYWLIPRAQNDQSKQVKAEGDQSKQDKPEGDQSKQDKPEGDRSKQDKQDKPEGDQSKQDKPEGDQSKQAKSEGEEIV